MKMAMFLLAAVVAMGQTPPAQPAPPKANTEHDDLQNAVNEAGTSPIDLTRVLEAFLKKYPNATQLKEIEKALTKAAIDSKDDRRTVLYGERALASTPDDIFFLDRVAKAELTLGGKEHAEKAFQYARHFQEIVEKLPQAIGLGAAKRREEGDRGVARGLLYQARAKAEMADFSEASKLAALSFSTYACEESAREWGGALASLGFEEQAVMHFADAFTIPDIRAQDSDRALDRKRMGELYRKAHGSEKGLGEVILQSYDRMAALVAERQKILNALDPNAGVSDPMGYTISGLDGQKLLLGSLKGKVVIMDFWATWCGPCRIQHPMYEQVKERFKGRDDVVLLSIDTDEDHGMVAPFLSQQNWSTARVYFEDGLRKLLEVNDIPTTIIFDKQGHMSSRMNGFLPEQFVNQLSERIHSALEEAHDF
ncbi:MAG: TlpA disulfide reductase family protein [Bryobacteraceae bacterium]